MQNRLLPMRHVKYEALWVGCVYFLILLTIALWVRDVPGQLDPFSTIQQVINHVGLDDPTYFGMAAVDIVENGWVSHAKGTAFVFNLWPPGFVLLEALVLKVLGLDAPVILVLQVLASILFAFVLVLVYEILSTSVRSAFAFILPLLLFAFPVTRVFLLEPIGISLGESFAIGFFLIGLLLTFRSITLRSIRYAVYAGLCIALAAYFRSQFELILLALTGWGILLGGIIKLMHFREKIDPELAKSAIKTMVVLLLVAHAATSPWRAYHWMNQGKPAWVLTSGLVFQNAIKTTDDLSAAGGFVAAGGGNLVCRIDPTTCGDTVNAKASFIKVFMEHPIEWYSLKLDIIGKYWFSPLNYSVAAPASQSTLLDLLTNGILLLALIVAVSLLFARKVRSHSSWITLMWFSAALLSAYLAIFTLAHFETRYFYFPKIAGVVMLLILACLYVRPMDKAEIVSPEVER